MNDPCSTDRYPRRSLALSLTALACAVHAAVVGAQELPPPPDTSTWACEDCTADTGTTGSIDVGGVGANGSDDLFGTFSGLKRDDAYLQLGGSARYRGSDAEYLDFDASRFNYDSERIAPLAPYVAIEGGKQGFIERN